MVLAVAQIPAILESAARSLELSLLARHAIGLARRFHSIYHKHPILQEEDEALRTVRLATATVFRKGLGALLGILMCGLFRIIAPRPFELLHFGDRS